MIYRHNQYNPSTRKYFNENTGNWVGYVRDKVMVEKYLRYEFLIIPDEKLIEVFGWNRKEGIAYFLTILLYGSLNKKGEGWEYIGDELLTILLGRGDKEKILRYLLDEGYIDYKEGKSNPYDYGKRMYQYRLIEVERYTDIGVKYIRNNVLTSALDRYYSRDNKDIVDVYLDFEKRVFWKYDISKKIDFLSLKKLDTSNSNIPSDIAIIGVSNGVYIDLLIDRWFKRDSYGYRRYSPIVNLKRKEREKIRFRSDKIISVDLKFAHIALFYVLGKRILDDSLDIKGIDLNVLRSSKEYIEDFITENNIFFREEKTFDFYNWISWRLKLDMGLNDIGNNREIVKHEVLMILGDRIMSNKTNKVILDREGNRMSREELGKLVFGIGGYEFIRRMKESKLFEDSGYANYTNINRLLTRMETKLMEGLFQQLIDRGVDYLSIHDGFICDYEDKVEVLNVLKYIERNNFWIKFSYI